jgi:hypothetical protein
MHEILPPGTTVLVRTAQAGRFVGTFAAWREDIVLLRQARRLWYWETVAQLQEQAPSTLPEEMYGEIYLSGVIELIPLAREGRDE